MSMFKMVFLGGLAFVGAVALFLGGVVMLTSWQSGAITWTYTSGGRDVTETARRAVEAGRFWQLYGTMGVLPALLGAAALLYSVRALKRGSSTQD